LEQWAVDNRERFHPEETDKSQFIQDVTSHMKTGAFTKQAKKAGMETEEFADYVLKHPDFFTVTTRRRAQFLVNIRPKTKKSKVTGSGSRQISLIYDIYNRIVEENQPNQQVLGLLTHLRDRAFAAIAGFPASQLYNQATINAKNNIVNEFLGDARRLILHPPIPQPPVYEVQIHENLRNRRLLQERQRRLIRMQNNAILLRPPGRNFPGGVDYHKIVEEITNPDFWSILGNGKPKRRRK
jgi:hypothetical protein